MNDLEITITSEDLKQSVENVACFVVGNQNLNPSVRFNSEAIAIIIKQHIENKIEKILNYPEEYLNEKEMAEIEQNIVLPYPICQKQIEPNIPYSA